MVTEKSPATEASSRAAPTPRVTDADGVQGRVVTTGPPSPGAAGGDVNVELDAGGRVAVPAHELDVSGREPYAYAGRFADLPPILPIVEEEVLVGVRETERVGLRLTKTIAERVETVDVPLNEQHVEVDRVIRNQRIDAIPPVRYEGDVMIVPVVDEVVVVEKRLVLREELRIRKSTVVTHRPQQITQRREVAHVERIDGDETSTAGSTRAPAGVADNNQAKERNHG